MDFMAQTLMLIALTVRGSTACGEETSIVDARRASAKQRRLRREVSDNNAVIFNKLALNAYAKTEQEWTVI